MRSSRAVLDSWKRTVGAVLIWAPRDGKVLGTSGARLGLWCSDGCVAHFCLHPHHVVFVGRINPFLGYLPDLILYLPLSGLGFTACCDVLNVGHNTIHDGEPFRGLLLGIV